MRNGTIVGWHRGDTGTQHCLACLPVKPEDGYPIKFGHPDWSEGSVPVCKDCRQEITTVHATVTDSA